MKSQLTLVAAVFFGAMGGSFLTRIIEPAEASGRVNPHCHFLRSPSNRKVTAGDKLPMGGSGNYRCDYFR